MKNAIRAVLLFTSLTAIFVALLWALWLGVQWVDPSITNVRARAMQERWNAYQAECPAQGFTRQQCDWIGRRLKREAN